MLVMLVTALVLTAAVIYAMARITRAIMRRFDLDAMSALVWLGLAEWPTDPAPGRPIIDI